MKTRVYTVQGPHSMFQDGERVEPGGEIRLQDTENVRHLERVGVIKRVAGGEPEVMRCPLCVENGSKRPVKTASQEELAKHYADKHPGFAVPEWEDD